MAKTVLNVKTDVEVKREAQKLAEKIGVPLSTIVNAQLKRFIFDGKVEFTAYPKPLLALDDMLRLAGPIFRKYGIVRAQLFGSYARGDARPDSDVDFLVAYGEKRLSLWDFAGMREDLAESLGREADIVSEERVIPYFRESIYRDLKPFYEE